MEVNEGEVIPDSESEDTSSTMMPTLPCAPEAFDESVTAHDGRHASMYRVCIANSSS